jgi:hypothetical protein
MAFWGLPRSNQPSSMWMHIEVDIWTAPQPCIGWVRIWWDNLIKRLGRDHITILWRFNIWCQGDGLLLFRSRHIIVYLYVERYQNRIQDNTVAATNVTTTRSNHHEKEETCRATNPRGLFGSTSKVLQMTCNADEQICPVMQETLVKRRKTTNEVDRRKIRV